MRNAILAGTIGLTAACSSGGVGATSGGTGGLAKAGGTTGGASVIGSCSKSVATAAYTPCSSSNPCVCPMGCVVDPAFAYPVCELPCSDDCPGSVTLPGMSSGALGTVSACVGGFCQFTACGVTPAGGSAPGSYDGLCTVVSPNDGTCLPTGTGLADGGALEWGICVLGNPEGSCGPSSEPSCAAGAFCIAGACRAACDPTSSSGCDGGSCQPWPSSVNPHAGYCGPPCSGNGNACVQVCCDPLSACHTGSPGTGTGGSNGICNPGG